MAKAPLLPTVDIMQFIREFYGQDYKPNSRETIRRQTLHQFEQFGLVARNRDDPNRPTNSKDNNYSLNEPIVKLLAVYPDGDWKTKAADIKKEIAAFQAKYNKTVEKSQIPITLPGGKEVKLSPGQHNQLHADIVHEFLPRFSSDGTTVLYIGDTASSRGEGGKLMVLEKAALESIGVTPMAHDKLPDIVAYDKSKNWLYLIEAVTSHGPVSTKRYHELEETLKDTCKAGRVYVTAFPDITEFKKHAKDIAWETEVWLSDMPDHMIHFNGDRFLGPR